MSFLTGLGDVAGGVSQGISPYLQAYVQQKQQDKEDQAVGEGYYGAFGVPIPGSSPPGGAAVGMGSLAPPPQQQAPPPPPAPPPQQARPPMPPPQAPMPGQGGMARSPVAPPQQPMAAMAQAQPQAAPQIPMPPQAQRPPMPPPQMMQQPQGQPPAMPRGAPMNAIAGSPQGLGPQAANAPSQQAVPSAQPPQPQQQAPDQQGQQQQRQIDPRFVGAFDFNTFASNMLKTPGMTPQKFGMITRQPGFERMLTQEGLNQYRALNLGMQQQRTDISRGSLGERTREDEAKDRRAADNERTVQAAREWSQKFRVGQQTIQGIDKGTQSKVAAINAAVQRGDIEPDEAQKQIQALNKEREGAREKVQKEVGDPPEMGGQEQSSGGSEGVSVIHDPKTGKVYKYKGSGDRSDMGSYAPVQ